MKKILIFSLFNIVFLSCHLESSSKKKHVTTMVKTSKSWDGSVLPEYPKGQPEITLLKIEIPGKSKLKLHKHTVINAGILLKGELTVVNDKNDTLYMKAGDPIVELVEKWHFGINEGTQTAEIVVFYAGVEGMPITVVKDKIALQKIE